MKYFDREDIVIVTTPLHHTSYRDIIEEVPKIDKCDLAALTHLFGRDMDLSFLTEFKKNYLEITVIF